MEKPSFGHLATSRSFIFYLVQVLPEESITIDLLSPRGEEKERHRQFGISINQIR